MALSMSITNSTLDKAHPNTWVVARSLIDTKRVTSKAVPIKESTNKKAGPRFLHGPALARNVLANWRLGTGGLGQQLVI